ncbi:hypothetical protein FRC02_008716 [Tulasnella sp. 418]|nr:hypothetical protein FRC02_008716 [Tulasnella sp. 418]
MSPSVALLKESTPAFALSIKADVKARAIHRLLSDLQQKSYQFFCPTPETQEISINKRIQLSEKELLTAKSVHDIWGWSIATEESETFHSRELIDQLIAAGVLTRDKSASGVLRPQIRVSCLYSEGAGPNYYVHSSWPTDTVDAVFFGPDSYRYIRYMSSLSRHIPNPSIAIDMCTGAGVGAIHLARMYPNAKVYGLDINPKALELASINVAHQMPNNKISLVLSDGFSAVADELRDQVDIVAIDPPFIAGDERTYASGGPTGIELTLRLLTEARDVLRVGGELWAHMAAPITFDGRDKFRESLRTLCGFEVVEYDVIDVDIFGTDIADPASYKDIGRLAAIGLVLRKLF